MWLKVDYFYMWEDLDICLFNIFINLRQVLKIGCSSNTLAGIINRRDATKADLRNKKALPFSDVTNSVFKSNFHIFSKKKGKRLNNRPQFVKVLRLLN